METTATYPYMTIREMYDKYPRKWLLVNNPTIREEDGDLTGGELVDLYDDRELASEGFFMWKERLNITRYTIINSLQEEL